MHLLAGVFQNYSHLNWRVDEVKYVVDISSVSGMMEKPTALSLSKKPPPPAQYQSNQ